MKVGIAVTAFRVGLQLASADAGGRFSRDTGSRKEAAKADSPCQLCVILDAPPAVMPGEVSAADAGMQLTSAMGLRTRLLLGALTMTAPLAFSAENAAQSSGCLYSVAVGPDAQPVVPCDDNDPLGVGTDKDVRAVMRTLGIEPSLVRFRGCQNSRFSAAPDGGSQAPNRRYVVTYPSNSVGMYLAPITHELAHVLQMERTGGLQALRQKLVSKRVELEADFLSGAVFAQTLKHASLNQFQHNLSLIGQYVELSTEAHGTPEQRTSAFRRGVFFDFETAKRGMRVLSEYFQANIYGQIVRF